MRIVWAVTCRSYELHDDRTARIDGAGVDTFSVPALPFALEAKAVVRLALHEGEEAELEAHFLGPRMSNVQTLQETIKAVPPPDHKPGFEVPMQYAVDFRFTAAEVGIHSVELYADEGRHRESLFWLVQAW